MQIDLQATLKSLIMLSERYIMLPAKGAEALLIVTGNRFFDELPGSTQAETSDIFAHQDAEGLKRLIARYGFTIIEAVALALDDAAKNTIGIKSSYHAWATGTMSDKAKLPQ